MAYGKGLNSGLRKYLMEQRKKKMNKEKKKNGNGKEKMKPAIPKKKAPKM
mgnify:CR=1 FL=1|tara:strand:- start:5342 stop:5491 length:150 start_codon:yes stop_codon:yes gene_type:complete